jgi:hypothetical protein
MGAAEVICVTGADEGWAGAVGPTLGMCGDCADSDAQRERPAARANRVGAKRSIRL